MILFFDNQSQKGHVAVILKGLKINEVMYKPKDSKSRDSETRKGPSFSQFYHQLDLNKNKEFQWRLNKPDRGG